MTPKVVLAADDGARPPASACLPYRTDSWGDPDMTLDQLYRFAARAGVTAAVLGIPADLFHFTMVDGRAAASGTLAFRFHGLALLTAFTLVLLALAAIVLAQRGRAGRLGLAGGLLALFGTSLVLGDLAKEAFGLPLAPAQLGEPQGYYLAVVIGSFALMSFGWLLTAVAARRAGIASRPSAVLLGVGAVLALPPIPGAYVTLLLGVAAVAVRLPALTTAPVPAERVLVGAHAG